MSASHKITIADDVRVVLEQCWAEDHILHLPPGQLAPALYKRVNKHIEIHGGKWHKGKKAHLFPVGASPLTAIGLALKEGHSIDKKVLTQAYYTPPELAAQLCRKAHVRAWHRVLEPSAGSGNIVRAALDMGAEPALCWAVELDGSVVDQLPQGVPFIVRNFLDVLAFPHLFDAIVMNPPFQNDQDIKHVLHAVKFLRRGGRLVSVMMNNQTRKAFEAMLVTFKKMGLDCRIDPLPDESFKSSGTKVPTLTLTLQYRL